MPIAHVNSDTLKQITWEKITENNVVKSKDVINNLFNCNLDDNKHGILKRGWKIAKKRYSKGNKRSETIQNFISKGTKGSKRYQILLEKEHGQKYCKILTLTQFKTFKKLTGINAISENRAKNMFGAWNKQFLSSEIKVFMFKFYNNTLGTNLRVSKFNYEISPECTFCSINGPHPASREDFVHLFFHCPTTKKIIQEFFHKYMTIQVPECEEFFGANLGDNEENNNCFQLVMDILRFYLWQAKLEKKLPSKTNVFENVNDTISRIMKVSASMNASLNNSPLFRHHRLDEPP